MTERNRKPDPPDPDDVIRSRVLDRVQEINRALITRLRTVEGDLGTGNHLAALGGLDGIEREIATMRSFLLLLC